MAAMRKSDASDGTHFRSGDRVFCLNGKWFYQTREEDHGPFPTRVAAKADLQRYVEEMDFFEGVRQDASTGARPDKSDADFADFQLLNKD
jgi:hypothetical protein